MDKITTCWIFESEETLPKKARGIIKDGMFHVYNSALDHTFKIPWEGCFLSRVVAIEWKINYLENELNILKNEP